MNFFIRALRFFISLEFFFCLAAVTAVFTTLGARYLGLGFWDALGLAPAKAFLGLIFLNRFWGLFSETSERKMSVFFSTGVLVAIIGLFINCAYRFEGVAALGEGEEFREFVWQESGPLGSPPAPAFRLESVDGEPLELDRGARAVLSGGAVEASLAPGEYAWWAPSLKIGVEAVDAAPRFEIKDAWGRVRASDFVKVRLYPRGTTDYFRVTPLPHRFYLSLAEKDGKVFGLEILRGKLVVAKGQVAEGEAIGFDGLEISFPEVRKWALIRVRKYPGDTAVGIGLVMAAVGGVLLAAGAGKE